MGKRRTRRKSVRRSVRRAVSRAKRAALTVVGVASGVALAWWLLEMPLLWVQGAAAVQEVALGSREAAVRDLGIGTLELPAPRLPGLSVGAPANASSAEGQQIGLVPPIPRAKPRRRGSAGSPASGGRLERLPEVPKPRPRRGQVGQAHPPGVGLATLRERSLGENPPDVFLWPGFARDRRGLQDGAAGLRYKVRVRPNRGEGIDGLMNCLRLGGHEGWVGPR